MALVYFGIYHDSALTTPVDALNPIPHNSLAPLDVQLWIGAANAGFKLQASSSPGIDSIVLTPTDSDPGSGQPDTAVKLATSQAGLTGATGGAALDVGVTISGGAGNVFPFWVRIAPNTGVAAVFTDLSLLSNALTELPV